jgi:hypothetical protein
MGDNDNVPEAFRCPAQQQCAQFLCAHLIAQHPHTADCPDAECIICATRDCPYSCELHYHHDGCPSCTEDDRLRAQEAAAARPRVAAGRADDEKKVEDTARAS